MANAADAIPPNADKALFAEDLINFVLHHHNGVFHQTWRARDFREFIHTGFNEDVQKAVKFIIQILEWEVDEQFSDMHEKHAVNIGSFVDYARHYQIALFHHGFEPGRFLLYCVGLASLASYFAKYHVTEALDACLAYILVIFQEHDMYLGGWNAINKVAKEFGKLSDDFNNLLTPETSDFDSDGSSDESQDEGEWNVYPSQRVEFEIKQPEESTIQKNSEDEDEAHNCMKDENDFNYSEEEPEVPLDGNSDQSYSENEIKCDFAQRIGHYEGYCTNFDKENPSKNPFKLENPQCDGKIAGSESRCPKLIELDCCKPENYDLYKPEEEIDHSLINQANIHFFIDQLQKFANQKRKYEQNPEQAECAFKRLKSVDPEVSCFEDSESSGDISNLHKNEEKITGNAMLIESSLLTESRQLLLHAPIRNTKCEMLVSRNEENCPEGMDFTKTDESNPGIEFRKNIFPSVPTSQKQERLNEQNNELKLINLGCSCSEISSELSTSIESQLSSKTDVLKETFSSQKC